MELALNFVYGILPAYALFLLMRYMVHKARDQRRQETRPRHRVPARE